MGRSFTLTEIEGPFAIVRMEGNDPLPEWALEPDRFITISRTVNELSIVCREAVVPAEVKCHQGWACLRVEGPFDLSEVGVLSSILAPLAESSASVLAISTFDTDYVLVRGTQLGTAAEALRSAGHRVLLR